MVGSRRDYIDCERTQCRGENRTRKFAVKCAHFLVLFNRPLRFCSSCESELRTIIGGSHLALNMLLVVCKFFAKRRRCKSASESGCDSLANYCWRGTTVRRAQHFHTTCEREKFQLLKEKKCFFHANGIKIHDPLPATIAAFPSRLQLSSLLASSCGVASQYLSSSNMSRG